MSRGVTEAYTHINEYQLSLIESFIEFTSNKDYVHQAETNMSFDGEKLLDDEKLLEHETSLVSTYRDLFTMSLHPHDNTVDPQPDFFSLTINSKLSYCHQALLLRFLKNQIQGWSTGSTSLSWKINYPNRNITIDQHGFAQLLNEVTQFETLLTFLDLAITDFIEQLTIERSIYESEKDFESLLACCDQLFSLTPSDLTSVQIALKVHHQRRDWGNARLLLETAANQYQGANPREPASLRYAAGVIARDYQQDQQAAVRLFMECLENNPEHHPQAFEALCQLVPNGNVSDLDQPFIQAGYEDFISPSEEVPALTSDELGQDEELTTSDELATSSEVVANKELTSDINANTSEGDAVDKEDASVENQTTQPVIDSPNIDGNNTESMPQVHLNNNGSEKENQKAPEGLVDASEMDRSSSVDGTEDEETQVSEDHQMSSTQLASNGKSVIWKKKTKPVSKRAKKSRSRKSSSQSKKRRRKRS